MNATLVGEADNLLNALLGGDENAQNEDTKDESFEDDFDDSTVPNTPTKSQIEEKSNLKETDDLNNTTNDFESTQQISQEELDAIMTPPASPIKKESTDFLNTTTDFDQDISEEQNQADNGNQENEKPNGNEIATTNKDQNKDNENDSNQYSVNYSEQDNQSKIEQKAPIEKNRSNNDFDESEGSFIEKEREAEEQKSNKSQSAANKSENDGENLPNEPPKDNSKSDDFENESSQSTSKQDNGNNSNELENKQISQNEEPPKISLQKNTVDTNDKKDDKTTSKLESTPNTSKESFSPKSPSSSKNSSRRSSRQSSRQPSRQPSRQSEKLVHEPSPRPSRQSSRQSSSHSKSARPESIVSNKSQGADPSLWERKTFIEAAPDPSKQKQSEFFPTAPTESRQPAPRRPIREVRRKPKEEEKKEEEPIEIETKDPEEYNKEDFEKGLSLLRQRKFPDPSMHEPLSQYIDSEIRDRVIEGDYTTAERLQSLQDFLNTYVDRNPALQSYQAQVKENKDKLEGARERHQHLIDFYKEKLSLTREDNQRRAQKLQQQQQKDLEEFEKQWQQPENLYQFSKPSAQLLYMRQNETHYALSKRFDHARALKLQADRLQREETRQARERAIAAMDIAYQKMMARHQKETTCMRQRAEQSIKNVEAERDRKIAASNIVIKRMEAATATMHPPIERVSRAKKIKDATGMRSQQTSLEVGGLSIKALMRHRKACHEERSGMSSARRTAK